MDHKEKLMRKSIYVVFLICVICLFAACGKVMDNPEMLNETTNEVQNKTTNEVPSETSNEASNELQNETPNAFKNEKQSPMDEQSTAASDIEKTEKDDLIDPEGQTIETRILSPSGYVRPEAETGSLLEYLRTFPVKEDGTPVLLHDGSEKWNQNAHVAILKLPIENADLQQCADSIMRIYAEYFLATGQADRISFHFTNGFEAPYTKWRDGYRIKVDGNQVSWVQSAEYDDSYENFVKYMRIIFTYAGTLSMDAEAEPITVEEMQVGDVFLKGGSPGHVVMVVDVCENEQGQKAFLLAQGYMPAQEFHVLKNTASETDPWYYEDEIKYPFSTPEYVFEEGSLQRLSY